MEFDENEPEISGSEYNEGQTESVYSSSKKMSTSASVSSKVDSKRSYSFEDTANLERDDEMNYEIEEEQEHPISLEHDFRSAKAFLQKLSPTEGISLYDHMSQLLNKVLSERPDNVIDFFEEYSRKMKEERFRPATDHLQDVYIPPQHHAFSKKLMPLFLPVTSTEKTEFEDEEQPEELNKPDLMELLFYFQQTGMGLPKNEMFCIALALRNLAQSQPIAKYRFWGKILGLEKNYIVAETELQAEEYDRRNMKEEEQEQEEREDEETAQEESVAEDFVAEEDEGEAGEGEAGEEGEATKVVPLKKPPKFPPIPQITFKIPPEVPAESSGQGSNKKVYYVCNSPGDEWMMLPDVTPKQIAVARKIKRYFTGNLETEILTYPVFPGKEINYLRAQIARISAGTQISPLGFYQFNEDEEEEVEEEEVRTNYIENPDFEPIPLRDLVDASMSFWVHHAMHILKQGRTKWWNPKAKLGDEEEEEEEEQEPEEEVEGQEVGPPLLTPLSEDATIENVPPWTVRSSSQLLPDNALAVIRSNLWPGAFAFAKDRKFENAYIGWGHKFVTYNYSPPPMDPVQNEYGLGPEIMEIADPTPEEEEAWRLAHEKPPKVEGEEEEEAEEEEEEEEEDD